MKRNIYFSFVTCSFCLFLLSSFICSNAFAGSVDDSFADVDKAKTESSAAKSPVPAKEIDSGDTLKTLKGVVYKNYKVTRTEPDGITISHSKGISKISFPDLPSEFAEKYNYDSQAAGEYARETAANRAAYAKEQKRATQLANENVAQFEKIKVKCQNCSGRGEVQSGMMRGDSHISYFPCSKCRGTGKVTRAVEVKPQVASRGRSEYSSSSSSSEKGDRDYFKGFTTPAYSEAEFKQRLDSLNAKYPYEDAQGRKYRIVGEKTANVQGFGQTVANPYIAGSRQAVYNPYVEGSGQPSAYGSRSAKFNTSAEAYAYMRRLNLSKTLTLDSMREANINGSLPNGAYNVDIAEYRVMYNSDDGMFWVIPR